MNKSLSCLLVGCLVLASCGRGDDDDDNGPRADLSGLSEIACLTAGGGGFDCTATCTVDVTNVTDPDATTVHCEWADDTELVQGGEAAYDGNHSYAIEVEAYNLASCTSGPLVIDAVFTQVQDSTGTAVTGLAGSTHDDVSTNKTCDGT